MADLLADHVFCHLFLAHAADGKLDDEEIMATRAALRPLARRMGHTETDVDTMVTQGIDAYWDQLHDEGPGAVTTTYRDAMHRLLAAMGAGIDPVLETLAHVAAADGVTDDMETLLMHGAVRQWQALHAGHTL